MGLPTDSSHPAEAVDQSVSFADALTGLVDKADKIPSLCCVPSCIDQSTDTTSNHTNATIYGMQSVSSLQEKIAGLVFFTQQ